MWVTELSALIPHAQPRVQSSFPRSRLPSLDLHRSRRRAIGVDPRGCQEPVRISSKKSIARSSSESASQKKAWRRSSGWSGLRAMSINSGMARSFSCCESAKIACRRISMSSSSESIISAKPSVASSATCCPSQNTARSRVLLRTCLFLARDSRLGHTCPWISEST